MKVIRVETFCEFIGGPCTREQCAAFLDKRPMTEKEHRMYNERDWPVTDPFVTNWCLKYNKQTVTKFRTVEA